MEGGDPCHDPIGDLDQVLKQAVGRQVKKLTANFKDQLRQGIMQKIKDRFLENQAKLRKSLQEKGFI